MRRLLILAVLLFSAALHAQQKTVLFDAMHAQTAGNADWVLDEDQCHVAQRFPTPDQSTITSSTPETFWSGGFSAFGIDLAKKGFRVESLARGSRVTFGDASNPQDLSNYDVYVIPEPNTRFTSSEALAIRHFVENGGGVLLIADHANSDRNGDGVDSPQIFNEMGTATMFGIAFNANRGDRTLGWFDDQQSRFTSDTSSPILHGRFGTVTRSIGLFGSTSMTLAGNATGHIWRSVSTPDTPTGVTFATSTLGSGRVAAVGDSSPAEDETNNCNHRTHPGYTATQFDNAIIFANAIAWLADSGTTPVTGTTLAITAPANGATVRGTVAVTATAPPGATQVALHVDGVLQSSDSAPPYTFDWDTTSVADGMHALTATADGATSTAVNVTVGNATAPAAGIDIGGWKLIQSSAAKTFTFPAGTIVPAHGYVVIGRGATQARFEAFWGEPLGADVVYIDGNGAFPQINGSEKYTLKDASGAVVDGPTIAMPSSAGRNVKRNDPCAAAGASASWTVSPTTSATPGTSTAAGCAKGVVINEFSDASSGFAFEFVELHNDQ